MERVRRLAIEKAEQFETDELYNRVRKAVFRDPLLSDLAAVGMEARKAAIHRRDTSAWRWRTVTDDGEVMDDAIIVACNQARERLEEAIEKRADEVVSETLEEIEDDLERLINAGALDEPEAVCEEVAQYVTETDSSEFS